MIASAACSVSCARRLARSAAPLHSQLRPTYPRHGALAALAARTHPTGMFVVTEAEAVAIRAVYEQHGEFSAAVELRRLFPSITDTAQARACARTIAGWKPLPVPPRPVPRLHPRRGTAHLRA